MFMQASTFRCSWFSLGLQGVFSCYYTAKLKEPGTGLLLNNSTEDKPRPETIGDRGPS